MYAFLQKPSEMRLMSARFRTLVEQGRVAEAMQPVNEALWLLGYGCYSPDRRILCQDLTPRPDERHLLQHQWLLQEVDMFNRRTIRLGRRVAEHYGYSYVRRHFCPVCWSRPQWVSEKELAEKMGSIVSQACENTPSIRLDNYAVTDESYRVYHIQMPVVWMRYSYLRRFRSGQDIINVYRMMKNSERIYDIPRFPYEGVPDYLI